MSLPLALTDMDSSPITLITSATPVTSVTPSAPECPKPPIATRNIFFPLSLFTRPAPATHMQPVPPSIPLLSNPPTKFDDAIARVEGLNGFLTPSMKCTLSSMLSVVNTHLSPLPSPNGPLAVPHSFVSTIASPEQSGNQIKDLVDIIENGLLAFTALGGGGSSVKSPSEPAPVNEPSETGASDGPRKRQRRDVDGNVIKTTRRSVKIRTSCALRDPNCQICNAKGGDVAHIIPYSVKGKKAIDFWKFVELFRGVEGTRALKAIALAPNPESVDNLKNVWCLCKNCHEFFGCAKLSVIPDLDGMTYPYDPDSTSAYSATIEFPSGDSGIGIACWRHEATGRVRFVGQLDEGDVITLSTTNALDLPLPHPLLFQLHAIISRLIGLKAAGGFPMFPDRESGNPDNYGVPAFVDNTYMKWLAQQQHTDQHQMPPEVLSDLYTSNSAEPHIIRWLKLTPSEISESDSDTHIPAQDCERFDDSDTDDERPRKYTVVLSEVGQRMAEKLQLASRRREMEEEFAY